jgi:hypothetical protein
MLDALLLGGDSGSPLLLFRRLFGFGRAVASSLRLSRAVLDFASA